MRQTVPIDFSAYITERTRDFTGREWVFAEIDRWLADSDAPQIFLLAGEPGIGKTAIAARLTQFSAGDAIPPTDYACVGDGFLSAVHFCSARNGGWISPGSFARSLSAQLATRYPAFTDALASDPRIHIEQKVGTVSGTMIGAQITNYYAETSEALFNDLVRTPLQALCTEDDLPGLLTILVDGLDESLNYSGGTNIVRLLVACYDLPPQVRLLLISRSVDGVLEPFRPLRPFILYARSKENQGDVGTYVDHRFATSVALRDRTGDEAQVEQVRDSLVARSGGNFLVVSKVLDGAERGELSLADPDALPAELQDLYAWFLDRLVQGDMSAWRELYRKVMGVLAVAQEPMDVPTLSQWTGLPKQCVGDALHDLREFLDPVLDGRYRLYHESVIGFLTGDRAGPYILDAVECHRQIAASYTQRFVENGEEWPDCDLYGLRYLPAHLFEAGKTDILQGLLFDFDWLQAKLEATDVNGLLADFELLPEDENLQLVQGAIRLAAHVLAQDKTQLAGQLLGRLLSHEVPTTKKMLERAKQWKATSWLRPLTPNLMPPGGPLLRTLTGHSQAVNAVAVIPDGRRAISASDDRTLKVWDLGRGQPLHTLSGHSGAVTGVAVTADGRQAISASHDATLKVWDLSGEELGTLTGHSGPVNTVAVTADGRQAISASNDCTLKVWDLESGKVLRTLAGHVDWVNAVAVTPDGRRVISASSDHTLKVWGLASGCLLRSLEGHTGSVHAVAVTPDGQRAISASSDHTLKVWDLASGCLLRSLEGHTGSVHAVAVTPDGRRAISVSDDETLRVWNMENGEALHTLRGHSGGVSAVAVIPDGRQAISASRDRTLKVWDISTGLSAYLERGKVPHTLTGHSQAVNAVAVTPDGRRAISASKDRTLKVWDLESGEELGTLRGHTDWVNAVAVTPDGRRVISGSRSRKMKVWDLERGEVLRTLASHIRGVSAIVVPSDGQRVISASYDGTLKVWDLESGEVLRSLEADTSYVDAMAVTPNSWQAIYDAGLTLKVCDLESGEELGTLAGHSLGVNAVAVMPDGRRAISASNDCTLKVWDLENGKVLRTLAGHVDWVNAVAVTPDGRRAISASKDRTLKVWDLESWNDIATFSTDAPLLTCTVAPDGITIVAGGASGRVHFLRLERSEAE